MLQTTQDFASTIANTKLIDTHVHFWQYDAESPDFTWVNEEMKILNRRNSLNRLNF